MAPAAAHASVSEGVQAWWQGRMFQLLLPPAAAAAPGGERRAGQDGRNRPAPAALPPRPQRLPPELLLPLLRLAGGELGHRLGALRHGVLGQLACMDASWGSQRVCVEPAETSWS